MTPSKDAKKPAGEIQTGERCLLSLMNEFFLVEILAVEKSSIHVTFPGSDYPIEGIPVEIQFHDKEGFRSYPTVCLEGPSAEREGILLQKPAECRRVQHRNSCRVPTDLTVQVKDQVHVRRFSAALQNLSAGGVLLECEAPFDFHTSVELTLSLPGEPSQTLLCQVLHIGDPADRPSAGARLFGMRFVNPEQRTIQCIERYVWRRINELYAKR
jgi:hypothetical protein